MPLSTNPAPPSLFRCASTRIADSPAASMTASRSSRARFWDAPIVRPLPKTLSVPIATVNVTWCQSAAQPLSSRCANHGSSRPGTRPLPASLHPSRGAVSPDCADSTAGSPPAWSSGRRTGKSSRRWECGRVPGHDRSGWLAPCGSRATSITPKPYAPCRILRLSEACLTLSDFLIATHHMFWPRPQRYP